MSHPPPESSPDFPSGYASAPAAVPTTWLALGIGCRSGASLGEIEAAVRIALGSRPISDVRQVATISSKLAEPALIEFCVRHGLPLVGFSGQAIDACMQAQQGLARSRAAREYAGVDGVCEPCALLAAPNGTLIGRKRALGGVTVAIAAAAVSQSTPGLISSSAVELDAIVRNTHSINRKP
jgi:cobalamin biosynthesis protein CbiG